MAVGERGHLVCQIFLLLLRKLFFKRFPHKLGVESLGADESQLLCLGSSLEKNSNSRGWSLPNKCYLCKGEEESTNHIFLHCPKASMLWHLILAIFDV